MLASRIFRWAGIYGLIVLFPTLFLEARIGIDAPPPITHPEYLLRVHRPRHRLAVGVPRDRIRPRSLPAVDVAGSGGEVQLGCRRVRATARRPRGGGVDDVRRGDRRRARLRFSRRAAAHPSDVVPRLPGRRVRLLFEELGGALMQFSLRQVFLAGGNPPRIAGRILHRASPVAPELVRERHLHSGAGLDRAVEQRVAVVDV